jgi:hypothetical protein
VNINSLSVGLESGQYPGRNVWYMQNIRLRNLKADRRWCAHGYARHGLLDGLRSHQYAKEGIQLQDRYLECRMCHPGDVGRQQTLAWTILALLLICGAGQSGLRLARLKSLNVPTLVVEKNPKIGDSWRNRYFSVFGPRCGS